MKKNKITFLGSLFYSIFISTSFSPSIHLSFEQWAEMSRMSIEYNEAISSFKEGKNVDFKIIFEKMESLAELLSVENNAKDIYLSVIQSRKKQIEELNKSTTIE